MKKSPSFLLLVLLIEALSVVIAYLKDRLMGNTRRSDDDNPYGTDFACC